MSLHPDTLAIHAGQGPNPATTARAAPIEVTPSHGEDGREWGRRAARAPIGAVRPFATARRAAPDRWLPLPGGQG
jgi:hypothetical protein